MERIKRLLGFAMGFVLGFGIMTGTFWCCNHVNVHLNHFDSNRWVVEVRDDKFDIDKRITFKFINGKKEPESHEVFLGELIGHEADYADWSMDFTGIR